MPNVVSLLTPRLPIRSRCLAFRYATTREVLIFGADDPVHFKSFVVFEKRSSERRRQVKDRGKVDNVEAASLGLPRLGGEIYNALMGRHAELIIPRTLSPYRTKLFDIIVAEDETLKFVAVSPPSDRCCNEHPTTSLSFCSSASYIRRMLPLHLQADMYQESRTGVSHQTVLQPEGRHHA